ncbi:MAG: HDOD domain-containing protein [Acidobacteria bacterium]|nr:HDOD domain-containing protein [Acidobacteriota bacterium]
MPQLNVDTRDTLYVARQPILDARGQVFGYELLYHVEGDEAASPRLLDLAAARVLTDAVLNVGLDTLTGGRPAFLNLSRSLLLEQAWRLLPPGAAVFELHQHVAVDEEVMEACAALHAAGYALALGDVALESDSIAVLPYVRFAKVDMLATPAAAEVAERLRPSGIRLVAENVEDAEAFDAARAAGYALFQGHYFCRPRMCSAAAVPARHVAYVQLLSALNRPDLTVSEVEDLVKHDLSLSYRVLRCINSAAFGLRREVHSIRQAIVLLGLAPIRSWASVWCLAGLNTGGTSELVTVSLIRARCCELLAAHLVASDEVAELFLIGLCASLDAMLGRAMEEAVADLPLSVDAKAALLGHPNTARRLLDAVMAYERGDWTGATEAAARVGLTGAMLAAAYTDALRWARELSRAD